MLLKDGGKTIELWIFEKDPMPRMGINPGVFPDKIVVKQRNSYQDGKDAPCETVVYIQEALTAPKPDSKQVKGLVEALEDAKTSMLDSGYAADCTSIKKINEALKTFKGEA